MARAAAVDMLVAKAGIADGEAFQTNVTQSTIQAIPSQRALQAAHQSQSVSIHTTRDTDAGVAPTKPPRP